MDTIELAVDGFPLDPTDADFRFHRELSLWLELENSNRIPVAMQFDSPAERPGWLRPALRRFIWVRSHGGLIAKDKKLDARIAHLISLVVNRLYKPESGMIEEATFAELAAQASAIEASGSGSMFRADTGRLLLDLVKTGIGPATRQSIRALLRDFAMEDRFGVMHELAWHLFLHAKDSDESDASKCADVLRDLQRLKPTRRKLWISLLKLAPVRRATDAKWEQKIREALERIGREDWETRLASWKALLEQPGSRAPDRPIQILLRLIVEIRRIAESPQPAPVGHPREFLDALRKGQHAGFEQAVAYTKQHGYKPEIVEAVREYHATLHGSVTDQARRQHVGWWLWLEDVTPIKAEECWSSIVRADLRNFTGARRKAWMELIGNMTFAVVNKPPAKWSKIAEPALAAVGPEDFANQMRRWLAPMVEDHPLRLTTPGRDVLRCLIWNASLCPPNPQLDETLAWIGKATWKNKESRDRLSKLAGSLNNVPEKPVAKPYDPKAAMHKAMSQFLKAQPLGERIEMHPDHIFVRGERDEYRIGMDGVVTRRSGRHVRVNMDALPPYITQLVQPAIDAMDLEQGMFQPNRMRLFSLATILAHDAQWGSAIE